VSTGDVDLSTIIKGVFEMFDFPFEDDGSPFLSIIRSTEILRAFKRKVSGMMDAAGILKSTSVCISTAFLVCTNGEMRLTCPMFSVLKGDCENEFFAFDRCKFDCGFFGNVIKVTPEWFKRGTYRPGVTTLLKQARVLVDSV
jgi:hypothetical protein